MNEITIPENTRVIIEDGVIIFESKEPVLKVGEWYSSQFATFLKIDEESICGFNTNKEWISCDLCLNGLERFIKPADPKEVARLLIGEAEKRVYKEGVIIVPDTEFPEFGSFKLNRCGIEVTSIWNVRCGGAEIFSIKTGLWREIIEEKKPLYVNDYGTEFFEGDEYWYVNSVNSISYCKNMCFENMKLCKNTKFRGTKKECYQYLADNCKE